MDDAVLENLERRAEQIVRQAYLKVVASKVTVPITYASEQTLLEPWQKSMRYDVLRIRMLLVEASRA